MKIIGKVYTITNKMEGESLRGPWVRQELIVEMHDGARLCFTALGDVNCNKIAALAPETMVEVDFRPECSFNQDRWFTKLKLINVTPVIPQP